MTWALFAVGVTTLALGINVLHPSRSLIGMGISFFAEWLVAELAHWTLLVLAAAIAVLAALGGLDAWPGWVGLAAGLVGLGLLVSEMRLASRSAPAVARALEDAGLGIPAGDAGRRRRLLLPFWLGDRRVERIADLRYAEGSGRRHLLDVYRPRAGAHDAPVLLQIHGGGWIIGNKRQQGRPLMNRMAAAGWVCVSINYRLAPRGKMPDQIVDTKYALAWIRARIAELGGDPRRVIVTGGSAGGHLAAMVGLTVNDPEYQPGFESVDTSVLAAVPVYPPTDLLALFDLRPRRLRRWLGPLTAMVFAATPEDDPERFRRLSPITLVRPGLPPFLVVQGAADNLVPVEQTRRFVEHLRETPGQKVVYLELPGAPHAFDVFHSPRAEAATGGIHRFCDAVISADAARAGSGPG